MFWVFWNWKNSDRSQKQRNSGIELELAIVICILSAHWNDYACIFHHAVAISWIWKLYWTLSFVTIGIYDFSGWLLIIPRSDYTCLKSNKIKIKTCHLNTQIPKIILNQGKCLSIFTFWPNLVRGQGRHQDFIPTKANILSGRKNSFL